MAGRSPTYTAEEVELLREVARELKAKNNWTQEQLGDVMGMEQQNAGRFVAARSTTGIDRPAANKLAQRSGFRSAEHLILERGVLAEMESLPQDGPWADRDVAVRIARRMGYADEVIDLVVQRFAEATYTSKGMKWWIEKVVLEAVARRDEAAPEPVRVPLQSGVAPSKRARKQRASNAKR